MLTREHGGTPIGLLIRSIVADPDHSELTDKAEALLIAADRAQHIDEVVRPALDAGRHVVSDRSIYSRSPTRATGAGSRWMTCAPSTSGPSVAAGPTSWCCSTSPDQLARRMRRRQLDRFERSGPAFYERVASGFRVLAAEEPDRWVVVEGDRPMEAVAKEVRRAVRDRLGLWTDGDRTGLCAPRRANVTLVDGDDGIWRAVVGQPSAIAPSAVAAKRDPVHAYLFVGPPGCTKFEAARAFAGLVVDPSGDADGRDARLARRR